MVSALGAPASAKKKKKKAKPQDVTFYLHGELPADEAHVVDRWLNDLWHTMDGEEPSGQAKSQFVTNYVGGPNTNCSGNGLLPVWKGSLTGKVKGDVKLTIKTAASPGTTLVADLYPDASGGCNESAQPSAGNAQATVAPGQGTTELLFENVDFEAFASLTLQLNLAGSPGQVRVFYDGSDAVSMLELKCTPTTGKSCT